MQPTTKLSETSIQFKNLNLLILIYFLNFLFAESHYLLDIPLVILFYKPNEFNCKYLRIFQQLHGLLWLGLNQASKIFVRRLRNILYGYSNYHQEKLCQGSEELFCEKKPFVAGNIMLQDTFCGRKRLVAGRVLWRKHFVRKCFVLETFC